MMLSHDMLLDRVQVYELFRKYFEALDSREWDGLDEICTPDVVSYWPSGPDSAELITLHGPGELVDWLRPWFDKIFLTTHHMFSNLKVTVADEAGRASCQVKAYHSLGDTSSYVETLATFEADLRRVEGEWRFSSFRESIVFALGDVEELARLITEHGLAPESAG